MHTARLQAGMMHVKPARAHEQGTMPAMQTEGSEKYPTPWDMPNQKKVASGANEHVHSSAQKEVSCCHWGEREMSGVITKLMKNLEFCESLSNQTDRGCSFGCWCPRPPVAALSKVMQNRERGRTTTPEHTNRLYMRIAIISLTVLENSVFLWAENSHSQLGVLQEEFLLCILSVSIFLTVTWPSRAALNQSCSRGWQSHFVLLWLTPFNRALNRIWVLTRN